MSKTSFVYVTYIRATPEKLWEALTDGKITAQYWAHRNVSDWRAGSSWQHVRSDAAGTVDLVGRVIESEPPKRLVITWATPTQPNDISRVTFEIERHREDTLRLTVTHTDLEPGSTMERGISAGWPLVLSSLKSFLETGQSVPL
ncbi:SRPBCC family protein [Microbacteriaceae bacterium K1510]|nr:SRPBCC family protein [Microbacteriaceae bacterium K1510]